MIHAATVLAPALPHAHHATPHCFCSARSVQRHAPLATLLMWTVVPAAPAASARSAPSRRVVALAKATPPARFAFFPDAAFCCVHAAVHSCLVPLEQFLTFFFLFFLVVCFGCLFVLVCAAVGHLRN